MKSINEQLAELCGWEQYPAYPGWWWARDGKGGLEGRFRIESWNPTTDLNQLKMCYEAAEKVFNLEMPHYTFAGTVFAHLKMLIRDIPGGEFASYPSVSPHKMMEAWVKHPELVAQAIIKAKGAS